MSYTAINWVLKKSLTKGSDRLVLLVIANHINKDGVAWPSIERIATQTGLNKRYVKRIIRKLERLGELKVTYRRAGDMNLTNYYEILSDLNDLNVGWSNLGEVIMPSETPESPGGVVDAMRSSGVETRREVVVKSPKSLINQNTEPQGKTMGARPYHEYGKKSTPLDRSLSAIKNYLDKQLEQENGNQNRDR